MGKRKSTRAKAVPRKKAEKLETTFCCPFCNHAGSVECTIDLKLCVAEAACIVCKETYSTKAHALTEPIDVYGEWIDECEKANQGVDHNDDALGDSYNGDDDNDYAQWRRTRKN